AAEERGVGLGGRVVDTVLLPVHREHERALAVHLRERANAVRREELVLVQHVAESTLETLPRRDREQPMPVVGLCQADVAGQAGPVLQEPPSAWRTPESA